MPLAPKGATLRQSGEPLVSCFYTGVVDDPKAQMLGADLRSEALPGWQTIYLHKIGAYF
jgi:hypothetical protein